MNVKHEFSFNIQQILHVCLCVIKQHDEREKMPRIRGQTRRQKRRKRLYECYAHTRSAPLIDRMFSSESDKTK